MERVCAWTALAVCLAVVGCGGGGEGSSSSGRMLWSVEVELASEGGLCAGPDGGGTCTRSIVVSDDGSWRASGFPEPEVPRGEVPVGAASELAEILERGWEDLTERPFEGTCPVAYDGSEVVYRVRRIPRGPGAERADASVREIRSCTHDLQHPEARMWVSYFLERWEELGLPD